MIAQRDTYVNGVRMLDECNVVVNNMSKELVELQPILVVKTQETEEIMKRVEQETAVAEKQQLQVQMDEVQTQEKAAIASGIQ